ncbi:hypothetical protein CEXT_553911 [Caerostris extrusa]|uniref:Uncharacterized protein n=1 Tax=Caerostris extrusa TaxID=172846 RepID=A0AAV4NL59_CAEEX|nr:hypothetical protein CEXT_553911 [Caerostris extrusa]
MIHLSASTANGAYLNFPRRSMYLVMAASYLQHIWWLTEAFHCVHRVLHEVNFEGTNDALWTIRFPDTLHIGFIVWTIRRNVKPKIFLYRTH